MTIAALERGDRSIGSALARLQQVLGGIEVAVETASGEWTSAGEVREMGPLATDLVVVPLPRNATGRVRLRLARGHWRLDYLASARPGPRVEPAVLEPTSVQDAAGRSIQAGALTTLPGDTYTYTFDVPAGSTHELFLDSRGYYLEWMRQEWLADENPRRAAQLLLDPESCCGTWPRSSNGRRLRWKPCSGGAAMCASNVWSVLSLVIASQLSGCAHNPAPKGWRLSAVQAQHSTRGGWIVVEPRASGVSSPDAP